MKLVKRISLFMTLSMVMLGLGGWGALKAEEFFYPHRYRHSIDQAGTETEDRFRQSVSQLADAVASAGKGGTVEPEPEPAFEQEQVIETAVADYAVVTADTLYLVEQVDLDKGTVTESEETIPVMYIGLSREELLEALSAYEENPPLTELEQGFETIELTAFSKDRVAVCKYYKEKAPQGFYLMVADHFIVVYEEDRSTLYMNTDILLERLPDTLQREIMEGKHMSGEEELYLFLESYSS
ncbi:MAG: hypothetical protein K2I53_14880 [Lachnospiraceae bacterium]|nr:hypothetical protein [Lachnospiraceae bacterium]